MKLDIRFGNLSMDLSLYDNVTTVNSSLIEFTNLVIDFNTTHAMHTNLYGSQYDCNMVFAALFLLISCILLLAGAVTLVLMSVTLAPDVIGYVSSFTRDNPYAELNQPSYLDGIDRAIAVQDCKSLSVMSILEMGKRGMLLLQKLRACSACRKRGYMMRSQNALLCM